MHGCIADHDRQLAAAVAAIVCQRAECAKYAHGPLHDAARVVCANITQEETPQLRIFGQHTVGSIGTGSI